MPTATIVMTMALGTGTMAAVAIVVWQVVLRPLPIPDPGRVVAVQDVTGFSSHLQTVSYPNVNDWRDRAHSFVAIAPYDRSEETLNTSDRPVPLSTSVVGDGFWAALGSRPIAGRLMTSDDFREGAAPVAVISYALWKRQFAGAADVVGSTIRLASGPVTVIGILPQDAFVLPSASTDLWMPLHVSATGPNSWQANRWTHWLPAIARVKPGVSVATALVDLRTVDAGMAIDYNRRDSTERVILTPLQEAMTGPVRPALFALGGAALIVMLVVFANIANVRLSQAHARQREFAMRVALGADGGRLAQLAIVEGLLLSCVGGALGLGLAPAILRGFLVLYPGELPLAGTIHLDMPVAAAVVVLSVVGGWVFALPQLLRSRRGGIADAVRVGARGSGSRADRRLRGALVVTQLALSVALLVTGGLLARTFAKLSAVNTGFTSRGVAMFSLTAPMSKYPTPQQVDLLFDDVLRRVGAIPGVQSAGMTNAIPLTGNPWRDPVPMLQQSGESRENMNIRLVSPHYLETVGFPLKVGRLFTDGDNADAPPVVVLSQTLATLLFPDGNGVGQQVKIEGVSREVIGVVGNIHQTSLAGPPDVEVYLPFQQMPLKNTRSIAVRTAGDSRALLAALAPAVRAADADLVLRGAGLLDEVVSESVAPQRFRAAMIGSLAVLALLLAIVGVYGVTSYSVAQRSREIGIRLALGDTPGHVARRVVGNALVLSCVGVGLGLVGGVAVARSITGFLYGVSVFDPVTFAAVPVVLVIATALAANAPARRAGRIDPLASIRSD